MPAASIVRGRHQGAIAVGLPDGEEACRPSALRVPLRPSLRWPQTDVWVRRLLQEFSCAVMDGEFGPKPCDQLLRLLEFRSFECRGPLRFPSVHAILPPPVVDGLVADSEVASDVDHLATAAEQIQCSLAELRRVTLLSQAGLLSGQQPRNPSNQAPLDPRHTTRYGERFDKIGARLPIGSVGDSYDGEVKRAAA